MIDRMRGALAPDEWLRLGLMCAAILALHFIGWCTLVLIVEPAHFSVGDKAFGIGIGLTAYTLGLRHAFDVDHIAAIDNTTRKLMSDGQRPLGVGFFFSLGHSSVVFGLALLLSIGVKAIVGPVRDDSSALHHYTSVIGTSVSGALLYLIAAINVVILAGILRVFARMRRGDYDEAELETHLNNRGLLNRLLGRFTRSVTASWHMYPVGLLFGLGFDTATEVALLVLAGTSAAAGLPWSPEEHVAAATVASSRGAGIFGRSGTAAAAGLTTLAGDEFADGPKMPMMPASWEQGPAESGG